MFALVTTALLFASASVQTQAGAPGASQQSAPAVAAGAAAPEKKVCRKVQESGSIMPKRTCYTQAQWDAIDRETGGNAESQLQDYRFRHSN